MTSYGWGRGWPFWEAASSLSVLEIANSGTIDLKLASLLWVLMEQRASVIVAAGPSRAGKSTTLNMLLDFLRPEVKRIELQGDSENFAFLKNSRPANTYMVAAEFSNWGMYVWGEVAIKAFELITKGYALGGTIHARSAREVAEILHRYLGLPISTIANIDLIVTLQIARGRSYSDELIRRIDTVSLVTPHEKGLSLETIASLDSTGNGFDVAEASDLQTVISSKLNMKNINIEREMAERERFLTRRQEEGKVSRDEVRQAIVDFYGSHPAR